MKQMGKMENFDDLKRWPLDKLAARMSGCMEGSISRSFYMAEFIRRQTKAQVDGIRVAVISVVVAAVAIVVGAAAQVLSFTTT